MKACIILRDGTERVLRLPASMDHMEEIVTAVPGELRNVRARYVRTTSRDVDVFVEVDDDPS